MKKIFLLTIITLSVSIAQFRQMDAAEMQIAVNKLSVLGSVLYVAAHPDDENTALLSYFAKGKLFRTAYLSITRGEGGQNLIGSELGAELGIIRTQELLAARKVDGAEQFFTRAIDFGYSKSSEEALRLWNKDSVLKDVVWVIRKFRPDIIITRFSPTQGGHGHHTASAILAEEAFKISGDEKVFPEQLKYISPWKAKRILFNHFRFGGNNSNPQDLPTLKFDVGEYNPLLGRSYTELAGISRTMHKSQGMGSAQNKGKNINGFVVTGGDTAKNDLLEGIDISWSRIPNGKKIAGLISDVQKKFILSKPEKNIPSLVKVYKELQKINNNEIVNRKMNEVESLIQSCVGLWIEAKTNNPYYSLNDSVGISLTMLNRSSVNISVRSLFSQELNVIKEIKQELKYNEPFQSQLSSILQSPKNFSQPHWLTSEVVNNRYPTNDPENAGIAENKPSITIVVSVLIENIPFIFTVPVVYKWIDDIDGEKIRNIEILPPVSVSIDNKNIVWNNTLPKNVVVRLRALRNDISGTINITVPNGWKSSTMHNFSMMKKENETELNFTLQPDSSAQRGEIVAEATINGEKYSSTVKHIIHNHIPVQPLLVEAKSNVVKLDLQKRGSMIGYIMGAGDEIPQALQQMGFSVVLISDEELQTGNLQRYDAIVSGVRAYNVREQLRNNNARLMHYVEQGGTFVVQYQVMERGQTDSIAPYKMNILRDRVTNEHAEMTFLKPQHPLLNYPNKITTNDFDGWVQERGLYFANSWDNKFETVISCSDTNEKAMEGSLLYAKYGKGHYIFTGLSFFRQLPAGVGGAYRLFANLISVGK